MMGDQFSTASLPSPQVKLTGTAPFSKIYIVKDGKYVYTREPKAAKVDFSSQDMSAEARNRVGFGDVDHVPRQMMRPLASVIALAPLWCQRFPENPLISVATPQSIATMSMHPR